MYMQPNLPPSERTLAPPSRGATIKLRCKGNTNIVYLQELER